MLSAKSKQFYCLFASITFALVFAVGCADDDKKMEDPVQPAAETPPPPPPVDNTPVAFVPETIYFSFDDYTLSSSARTKLQALADHLNNNNNAVVQVEGHCDERGSIEYNLALGERRAQSVLNYLVELGIDTARLNTISYGEEKPAVDGHSESAWSQNRRAEFVITSN